MKPSHPQTRKVTVVLPASVVDNALHATGKTLTETVRLSLEELAHRQGCLRLLAARGTFDPGIDLKALREDREF